MNTVTCQPRVRFIPHYLKDQVLNDKVLSSYDYNDLYAMGKLMTKGLLGAKSLDDQYVEATSKLLNLYTSSGEYVFSESVVLINDEVSLEIIIKEPTDGSSMTVNIICSDGSTNAISQNSVNKKRAILIWLIDYLGKRLDESAVYDMQLFSGYWLK